jgi:hypothetical protein
MALRTLDGRLRGRADIGSVGRPRGPAQRGPPSGRPPWAGPAAGERGGLGESPASETGAGRAHRGMPAGVSGGQGRQIYRGIPKPASPDTNPT